jgi:hypothetical protein
MCRLPRLQGEWRTWKIEKGFYPHEESAIGDVAQAEHRKRSQPEKPKLLTGEAVMAQSASDDDERDNERRREIQWKKTWLPIRVPSGMKPSR